MGLRDLLNQVAFGNRDPQVASTIAGRLARLDKRLTKDDRAMLADLAGGMDLGAIARNLVTRSTPTSSSPRPVIAGRSEETRPRSPRRRRHDLHSALEPLATNPDLRNGILDVRKSYEQTIDETVQGRGPVRRPLCRGPRTGVSPGRLVPAVHRGAQGRDPRSPGPLQPPLQARG